MRYAFWEVCGTVFLCLVNVYSRDILPENTLGDEEFHGALPSGRDFAFRYLHGEDEEGCESIDECEGINRVCKNNVCQCKEGYGGGNCNDILECDENLKKTCSEANAKCYYDDKQGIATCECYDRSSQYINKKCMKKCEKNDDCYLSNMACTGNICQCIKGYGGETCKDRVECDDQLNETCIEANAECYHDDEEGIATCKCNDESLNYVNKKCVKVCWKNDDCDGNNMACRNNVCQCKFGYGGENCNEILDCDDQLNKTCIEANAECYHDNMKGIATCKCNDESLNYVNKKCVKVCWKNDDCDGNNMACRNSICQCKTGYGGENCNDILGCDDQLNKTCIEANAECYHDVEEGIATCKCKDESFRYVDNKCLKVCWKNDECDGNNMACRNNICHCKLGYGGENCNDILGCDTLLNKTCIEANAECYYVAMKGIATCKCSDESFRYIDDKCMKICEKNHECNGSNMVCRDNICQCKTGYGGENCNDILGCDTLLNKTCIEENAECYYDVKEGIATCKCNDETFTYIDKKCMKVCWKNDECDGNNMACRNNICHCKLGYGGENCNDILGCDTLLNKTCIEANAECYHDDEGGITTCKCIDESFIYIDKKCKMICEEDNECDGNNMVCRNNICQCKMGYGGENCIDVLGCDTLLNKTCNEANAECYYDDTKGIATCKCNDESLNYVNKTCTSGNKGAVITGAGLGTLLGNVLVALILF